MAANRRLTGSWDLSQTYLDSTTVKHIDFTGEGSTVDAYGHGTHTAGIAAGTGQSSENYAGQHAGSPTYGGVAAVRTSLMFASSTHRASALFPA